jgi:hypothetical protein
MAALSLCAAMDHPVKETRRFDIDADRDQKLAAGRK